RKRGAKSCRSVRAIVSVKRSALLSVRRRMNGRRRPLVENETRRESSSVLPRVRLEVDAAREYVSLWLQSSVVWIPPFHVTSNPMSGWRRSLSVTVVGSRKGISPAAGTRLPAPSGRSWVGVRAPALALEKYRRLYEA